ncbi:MAG: hypothetical protein A4E26_01434 [Methanobacterium sp. PtaU1.Bin097]|jgi:hypothetical protein|nr:MAG: hypothetical protein A4E26_01434 [Methanobacterium sp. PtaU1.Bin097]
MIITNPGTNPKISSEFKKELKRVRKEVEDGKYVSYKTIEEMDKDISD